MKKDISDMESVEADLTLPEELLLLEYQASEDHEEGILFYRDRDHFRLYWEREGWLKLDFEKGEPCIRATHFVGLMPFRCDDKDHLIMVAPKGCSFDTPDKPLGLLRFLDLAAIAYGGEPIQELHGVSGKLGRNTFIALLAAHYSQLLHQLCRRDYRRYFRPEEEDLNGRVRGRIKVAGHIRNALRGREHRIPCRWEEFTSDNWDNRILLGATRRLQQTASILAPEAGRYIRDTFIGVEPWFSSVKEVSIRRTDFSKARLWRTSRYYRNALAWARLIVQGLDRPLAAGEAPPLAIDANDAFERFAKVVTRSAVNALGGGNWEFFKAEFDFLRGCQHAPRRPDLAIRSRQGILAVGEAKYKEVLDQSPSPGQLSDLSNGIIPRIGSADWNQLYVYLRLANASYGFFVVPFWNPDADAAQLITRLEFEVSPLDRTDARSVRLAVIGLNLLQPIRQVRDEAVALLSQWFRNFPA
jgi:McrBC 5-methylcytosine restriction system component